MQYKKAHDILTKEACNPPTIKNLSKRVFLNEQKLRQAFLPIIICQLENILILFVWPLQKIYYPQLIYIEEISKKVGYNYCGNFVKMFKKVHGKTPLAFRKSK